ncbi:MAG: hypothetical protein L6244_08320 [Candidatus Methanoperedenaceae archaeon]|nr:hypothetical protein [Candidatus Methanoperedenaceae archaeon]
MSILNIISNFFKKNNTRNPEKKGNKLKVHDYTGKFVKQNGTDIGESIAVDKNRIIVKNADSIFSISAEAVTANAENILVGDFNMEEAIQRGKEWFEKKDTLKFDEKGMLIK